MHPFALSLSKGQRRGTRGFDRLSPNGVGLARNGAGPDVHCMRTQRNSAVSFGQITARTFFAIAQVSVRR